MMFVKLLLQLYVLIASFCYGHRLTFMDYDRCWSK